MLDIFVASKNSILPNYLFLFLKEFAVNQKIRLAVELNKGVDMVIIDTETTSPEESEKFMGDYPVLLFARHIRPFLISYTSKFDINGVISLDMEPEAILKTMEQSILGEIYYDEEMISILFSPKMNELANKVGSITAREIDIVQLMLKDRTNEEIAEQLKLSVRTVNAHKGNIMRKIGAKTTSGMVKIILDYSPYFDSN
ncbi:MAG: response regulator transcription factor [Cyclobacteriaceae bacterium]